MATNSDWAINATIELLKANIERTEVVVKPDFVIDFIDKVYKHLKDFNLQ